MKRNMMIAGAIALALLGGALAATTRAGASNPAQDNSQVARIYELQSAFHRAATLQAPGEVDIEQRITDMLALWTDDGSVTFGGVTYQGKDPCTAGSTTLCDFFTNVAPPFQNPWISFAPAFKTDIDVHGNTASLDFQCHYFDVNGEQKARILVESEVVKVGSDWLLDVATFTPGAPAAVYP